MISSLSRCSVSLPWRKFAKGIFVSSRIVLEQHENPFTGQTCLSLLSRSFHIYGRIFFMSQSQKHLSRLKCLLSKRIVESLERQTVTDHALDRHSTLGPSSNFIPLRRSLSLVKCPPSRCSHEPFVLTLRFFFSVLPETDPISQMRLTP